MKKVLLMAILIGLCVAFFFIAGNRKFEVSGESRKIDVAAQLKAQNEQLDIAYPSKPQDVINLHNKLMSYLYSESMKEESIDLYVKTVRKLYDKKLLDLNTEEDQKNIIIIEREQNKAQPLKLLGSKIAQTTINNKEAEIAVIHYLKTGEINRNYTLTKESGSWKILSWKAPEENSDQSEE